MFNRCACSRIVTAALGCAEGMRAWVMPCKDGHEAIASRFIDLTPTGQNRVEKGGEVPLDQVIERFWWHGFGKPGVLFDVEKENGQRRARLCRGEVVSGFASMSLCTVPGTKRASWCFTFSSFSIRGIGESVLLYDADEE